MRHIFSSKDGMAQRWGRSLLLVVALFAPPVALAQEDPLRVFAWNGYVTKADVAAVNARLVAAQNPVRVQVIDTLAEGPEQMFNVIRQGKADVAFLTLNYLKMQNQKTAMLLQPIDVNSPRMPNYRQVLPALRAVPMGMVNQKPLYVPFGGGAYGLWANMRKVKKDALPKSLNDLLDPKWRGRISLTRGQVQPNVALAMMATGLPPFILDDYVVADQRAAATALADNAGAAQSFLNRLYRQVGTFWENAPVFSDDLWIVASYGPELAALKGKGQDWQMINFKEGNTVWLDTMGIAKGVTGKRLEAAEIFIDYFLSKEVQNRVVQQLSMVAVTQDVRNPQIEQNPNFFQPGRFWPPYQPLADNLMRRMSNVALEQLPPP